MKKSDVLERFRIHRDAEIANLRKLVPGYVAEPPDYRLRALEAIPALFDNAANAALGDKEKSAFGKIKMVRDAHGAAKSGLSKWNEEIPPSLKTHKAQLVGKITPAPKKQEPLEALGELLRHQEIRRGLENLDPVEVADLYISGSDDFRKAVDSAPAKVIKTGNKLAFVPFANADLIDNFKAQSAQERAEQDHPEEARQLKAVTATLAAYEGLANALGVELDRAVQSLTAPEETGITEPAPMVSTSAGA